MKLKALLDEKGKKNAELIAVSVDNRELLQTMADKIAKDGVKPDFTFLSDPGHRVIDRYGLLNPDNPRGIPHPTTYVIDQKGIVRWKFTEVNYKIRPTNEMIMDAAGYGWFRYTATHAPARVQVGARAPDFSAVTLDAPPKPRSLGDYKGSPVLLNVWATWCDPCREEMPSMQRLYDAYKDRGLRVVAVSVDDRGNEGLIREFAAEHHLTFDILHQGAVDMMNTYQVRGVPQTFLISRTGELVATRFVGDWNSAESRQLVDRLLFPADAAK